MPYFKFVFAAAALLVAANAKTVKITATNDRFDPDSTTVKKGDIGTGFFSGFISGSSGKAFRVEVDNTDAMIFYSSQGNACAFGMVGIINPRKNKSLQDYKSRASKLSEGVSPGYVTFGGELMGKGSSYGDSKSGDKYARDDRKSGEKSDQDDRRSGKYCKKNSAGMIKVSTVALAGIFGIALYISDAVREGNMGGGIGMICQGFKGGIGTSSRIVPAADEGKTYTVAALVQANYGRQHHLHISGVPVGRILADQTAKKATEAGTEVPKNEADAPKETKDGSIIIILATDAPLHPTLLQLLAKRTTVGLARVGGYGHNPSGDIFMAAFSTANEIAVQSVNSNVRKVDPFKLGLHSIETADDQTINALFEATADATEEAIYNALCMAETMVGNRGHCIEALPLDRLKEIMDKYHYSG